MTKLWGGRFGADAGKGAEGFTSSLSFDRRLYDQDIRGSMAHARMLGQVGVLSPEEAEAIVAGLEAVREEIETGQFPFREEFEDIHLNIERRLIEKIGPLGGKLHTARSRNDQVVTDMHLLIKEEIENLDRRVVELQTALLDLAEANLETIMPGYTHLQRAQPVLFAHHLMAYFAMLDRDRERLAGCHQRADRLPLGAAALAGTSFPIDPGLVAKELGFAGIYDNSMDAVSDRDFLLEFLAASAVIMVHLSRFCEELVLWSSREFAFIELDDRYTTGSSIMPQKKNPDVAELVRGKTGRVFGHLMGLLTVMKGLPLAYHTDMQEDKEGVFDTVDTLHRCLGILPDVVRTMRLRKDNMARAAREDYATATDLADYLVRKGMPFREAHGVVGRAVGICVEEGIDLDQLGLERLRELSPLFDDDALACLEPERIVAARCRPMGTARERVEAVIRRGRERVAAGRDS